MYGRTGKIIAQPGQRDALVKVLLRAAEALGEAEGCYLYVVGQVPDEADTIWITEVWRSAADHRASLDLEAIQALIRDGRPLIVSMTESYEVIPVGGKGLP